MIKVTYTTRFSTMDRYFATSEKAARYAIGIKREFRRVGVPLTSLVVDGQEWI